MAWSPWFHCAVETTVSSIFSIAAQTARAISFTARRFEYCDESRIRVFVYNGQHSLLKMSCCSARTIEDTLEPYELRARYISQIQRLSQKGLFGQAVHVFKEVSLACLILFSKVTPTFCQSLTKPLKTLRSCFCRSKSFFYPIAFEEPRSKCSDKEIK